MSKVAARSALASAVLAASAIADDQWEQYKKLYGKEYDNSNSNTSNSDAMRHYYFTKNMEFIEAENAKGSNTYQLGWGPFTDWSTEEFRGLLMKQMPPSTLINSPEDVRGHGPPAGVENGNHTKTPLSFGDVPDAINWADRAVTAVKDQGQCGSCWAFSAIEMVESRYWWNVGKLPQDLSIQQMLDCSGNGCAGGWPEDAYKYILSAGAVESVDKYGPYTAKDGSCSYDCNQATYSGAELSWWQNVYQNDEEKIKNFLGSYGPLSACGSAEGWSHYSSGIYNGDCSGDGHCWMLTGYDINEGYWWVRNSWGTGWGIDGYMKLAYGVNQCGVASHVTDVEVSSKNGYACTTECFNTYLCGCPCDPKYDQCPSTNDGNCYASGDAASSIVATRFVDHQFVV